MTLSWYVKKCYLLPGKSDVITPKSTMHDAYLALSYKFVVTSNDISINIYWYCVILNDISFVTEHPWILNAKKASNVPLGDVVKSRLKQFSLMNRFKRKALRVGLPHHFIRISVNMAD